MPVFLPVLFTILNFLVIFYMASLLEIKGTSQLGEPGRLDVARWADRAAHHTVGRVVGL